MRPAAARSATVRSVLPQSAPPDVKTVAWHPTEDWAAIATPRRIEIWRADATLIDLRPGHRVRDIAISSRGDLGSLADGHLTARRLFDGAPRWSLPIADFVVRRNLAVLGDGRWVTTVGAGADARIVLVDPDSGEARDWAPRHGPDVAASSQYILASGDSGFWVLTDAAKVVLHVDHDGLDHAWGNVIERALAPTGPEVVAVMGDWQGRTVVVFAPDQAPRRLDLNAAVGGGFKLQAIRLLPDGEHGLVSGHLPNHEGVVARFRLRDGAVLARREGVSFSSRAWLHPRGHVLMTWDDERGLAFHPMNAQGLPGDAMRCKVVFAATDCVGRGDGFLAMARKTHAIVWDDHGPKHTVKRCGRGLAAVAYVDEAAAVVTVADSDDFAHDLESGTRTPIRDEDAPFRYEQLRLHLGDDEVSSSVIAWRGQALIPWGPPQPKRWLAIAATNDGAVVAGVARQQPDRAQIYGTHGARLGEVVHDEPIAKLGLSPSGTRLLIESSEGSLAVVSLPEATVLATIESANWGRGRAWFLSDDVVAFIGGGSHPQLWKPATGERMTLLVATAKKWAVIAEDGRYGGSKSGLAALRIFTANSSGADEKAPVPTKAHAPTVDLLVGWLPLRESG